MRKNNVRMLLGICVVAVTIAAWAQASRKPGLWEMTSTMTWQQSPLPPGMTMPPGASSPFGGGAHTTQVCVTQAMIDKYGAPVPQSNGGCQVSNVQMKSGSMTADWVCTGMMAGKGTVESSWSDSNHATSKIHFTGSMKMGPNPTPVEYTIVASSTYKGADCGSVKPLPMLDK
jgi:hypothetical protein